MAENHIPEYGRLITIRMVADETGLSEPYIQQMMREGQIPCIRIGQKYRMTQRQWEMWCDDLESVSKYKQKVKKGPIGIFATEDTVEVGDDDEEVKEPLVEEGEEEQEPEEAEPVESDDLF